MCVAAWEKPSHGEIFSYTVFWIPRSGISLSFSLHQYPVACPEPKHIWMQDKCSSNSSSSIFLLIIIITTTIITSTTYKNNNNINSSRTSTVVCASLPGADIQVYTQHETWHMTNSYVISVTQQVNSTLIFMAHVKTIVNIKLQWPCDNGDTFINAWTWL